MLTSIKLFGKFVLILPLAQRDLKSVQSEIRKQKFSANLKTTGFIAKMEECQQASNMIVFVLSDHALRVVRNMNGSSLLMIGIQ